MMLEYSISLTRYFSVTHQVSQSLLYDAPFKTMDNKTRTIYGKINVEVAKNGSLASPPCLFPNYDCLQRNSLSAFNFLHHWMLILESGNLEQLLFNFTHVVILLLGGVEKPGMVNLLFRGSHGSLAYYITFW